MAKEYVVSRAFLGSVSKEDKTPQVIQTKAGNCHKYMVQFEGEEDKGWIQILRKIDNGASKSVDPKDIMYGDLVENNWGRWEFKRAQQPYNPGQAQTARPQPQQTNGGSVERKLDYIISLLENRGNFRGDEPAPAQSGDVSPEDIDDGPVDLSQIDY